MSEGGRGFGLVRFRSVRTVEQILQTYHSDEIVVQDVAVVVRPLTSEYVYANNEKRDEGEGAASSTDTATILESYGESSSSTQDFPTDRASSMPIGRDRLSSMKSPPLHPFKHRPSVSTGDTTEKRDRPSLIRVKVTKMGRHVKNVSNLSNTSSTANTNKNTTKMTAKSDGNPLLESVNSGDSSSVSGRRRMMAAKKQSESVGSGYLSGDSEVTSGSQELMICDDAWGSGDVSLT